MKSCDNPTISVIVPVYNAEKYLPKCIESILNQSFTDFELLLIDDGSSDQSGLICEFYEKKDNRIRVFHKANEGQASARNLGLDYAAGKYISFIDSDDYIANDMLEHLHQALNGNKNWISMCGRYNVSEETNAQTVLFVFRQCQKWSREEAIKRFLTTDGIDGSPCDKLIPRAIVGDIRFPGGYICEDLPFIYRVLKRSDSVVHIGEAKYNYLQRSGSTSRPKRGAEKLKGLLIYPNEIRKDVCVSFPTLIKEADYFYFSRSLLFQKWIVRFEMPASDYYKNLTVVRDGYSKIMNNPYFSWATKIDVWFYKHRLDKLLYKTKHIIKKIKKDTLNKK